MRILCLLMLVFLAACSEPKRVTFNPDDHTATSGTLGSAKSTTQVPAVDTTIRKDTLRKQ